MPLTCKYRSLTLVIRELKQRPRLQKRPLNSEFALLQTLLGLFHLVQFDKCWQIFLEVNSKRLDQSSGKEKGSRCLVCTSSTRRENRHFYVEVVQRRLRNVQKSVIHVQSCCFANLRLLLFCRSRFRYRRRSLSSLTPWGRRINAFHSNSPQHWKFRGGSLEKIRGREGWGVFGLYANSSSV